MDAETRDGIEKLRKEVFRDRRRLDAQSLGLMFLFQAESHPNRQMLWRDLTSYPGGSADWFLQENWLCGIAVPNADRTDVDYCDVFFSGIHQKAIEKFREHACEIASLFEDAGLRTSGLTCREGTLARYLFEFNRDSNSLEWEENEQPGHPETKSRIARLHDVFGHTESLLRSLLATSFQNSQQPKPRQRRRGRPNLNDDEVTARLDVLRRWNQEKDRKSAEAFCSDETALGRKIDPAMLEKFVNWNTQRKTRKAQRNA